MLTDVQTPFLGTPLVPLKTHVCYLDHRDLVFAFPDLSSACEEQPLLFVCNFSNKQFSNYAMGVPVGGTWKALVANKCVYISLYLCIYIYIYV